MFNWKEIKKPILALAPMADYTDSPFSVICKKMGADLIYREMVSADATVHQSEKTLVMAGFDKKERPIILQIFGKDPGIMAEAARILEARYAPDGIDINMGCPARKIVSNFNGASLMKEPKLASDIIKAVKEAVKVPVSVKTRTGWERPVEILKFSKIIEDAGADALAVHGRTKKMGYSGVADWEIIAKVKKSLSIPVLLNGDVAGFNDFSRALQVSEADGVLIGRGAMGRPWVFENIKNKKDAEPDLKNLKKIILSHLELHLKHYGERGVVLFRKHLAAYFKGMEGARKIRTEAVMASSEKEIKKILSRIEK
ncbi:MAG: tRNA dihydrouridine synthase DusB [Patescibacteria group bacterium]